MCRRPGILGVVWVADGSVPGGAARGQGSRDGSGYRPTYLGTEVQGSGPQGRGGKPAANHFGARTMGHRGDDRHFPRRPEEGRTGSPGPDMEAGSSCPGSSTAGG